MIVLAESSMHDVQMSVGKDFVIMGADRVEVSSDGKKVTAYTNNGVETKAAAGETTQGISISPDFNSVVLNGATIERAADGHLIISTSGTVITKAGTANDATKSMAALQISDKDRAGDFRGEIFVCVSTGDNKPVWLSKDIFAALLPTLGR